MSNKVQFLDTGIGEGILGIAALIGTVALIGLIVGKADNVSKLIGATTTGYNTLLKTALSGGGGLSL